MAWEWERGHHFCGDALALARPQSPAHVDRFMSAASLSPMRRTLPTRLMYICLLAVALAAGGGCGSFRTPTITVLTYNIHHGAGGDGKVDIGRIAEVINRVKPDLVALQEVDRKTNRTG